MTWSCFRSGALSRGGVEVDGLAFSGWLSDWPGVPLFLPDGRGRPPGRRRCEDLLGPELAEVADRRQLNLAPGRHLRTRLAGVFLFLTAGARDAFSAEAAMGADVLDAMMILVMQLGVIVFAARLMGMLFERMHLSSLLGELIAGMVIGPYALGGIPLPFMGRPLFVAYGTIAVSPELYGFSS